MVGIGLLSKSLIPHGGGLWCFIPLNSSFFLHPLLNHLSKPSDPLLKNPQAWFLGTGTITLSLASISSIEPALLTVERSGDATAPTSVSSRTWFWADLFRVEAAGEVVIKGSKVTTN